MSSKEVLQSLTVLAKRGMWGFEPSGAAGRHDSAFPQKHFSHCALMLLKPECALASPRGLLKPTCGTPPSASDPVSLGRAQDISFLTSSLGRG